MVNKLFLKFNTKGLKYAPFFLLSLLFLSCSKNYSDYLVTNYQQDGTLYFITPQNEWFNKQLEASLRYDLTHKASADSLTINFSVYMENIRAFSQLTLINENYVLSNKIKKIFVRSDKNKIHHRLSSTFSFSAFDSLLAVLPSHPTMILKAKDKEITMDIKPKDWAKQRKILQNNFEVIKANR